MSKIDKEILIQLKREGKTNGECAKVFGCGTDAVRLMCKKLEAEGRLPTTAQKAQEYTEEKALQTCDAPATKTVAQYLAEEEAAERARLAEDNVLTDEDEICYEPVEPETVEQPDPVVNANAAAYPIPPIDRKSFWSMRCDELRGAICEYACYGLRVDPAWVEEYNELIERCGR